MLYRLGDSGAQVQHVIKLLVQARFLSAPIPGHFDQRVAQAVRAFQQHHNLVVDGIVGPATLARLRETSWQLGDRVLSHQPEELLAGDDVYALQTRLLELGFQVSQVDGFFGPETEAAVREFQLNSGLPADGVCGPATMAALQRLTPLVQGGAPNALRAQERIRDAGPALTGRIVLLDPATFRVAPEHQAEAVEIVYDVVERVEGRLLGLGVQTFMTSARPGKRQAARAVSPHHDEEERAQFANVSAADLAVSLAVEHSDNPYAGGIATYFFGTENPHTWSSDGERLAGLVQREIVARTGQTNLRHHAKAWEFLRRTTMPAIRVELGYLTHPTEGAQLADAAFRERLAEALVVSIQRFYLTPELDAETGVLDLQALRDGLRTWGSPNQ